MTDDRLNFQFSIFNFQFSILKLLLILILVLPFLHHTRPASAEGLEERVKEHTLTNGLKLLMLERHASPTVATSIMFRVGSGDEEAGYSGIAHMLEHMLFKGTKTLGTTDFNKEKPLLEKINAVGEALDRERKKGTKGDPVFLEKLEGELKALQADHKQFVVKDEFSEIYSRNGGVGYNAWTSADATSYVIRFPSNKLELWAAIESDRMKNPVLREYYSERDVVMEERRGRYDNDPGGNLYENMLMTAFNAGPYSHPTIGWPSDLSTLPKKRVRTFLETYYVPNNCVMAVVGDITPDNVIALVERWFGDIPARPIPERGVTSEPVQKGEKRIEVEFDANPTVLIAYHKPNLPHDDDYTFDVIDSLLSGGRTSRLYKRMVLDEKVAVSVGTFSAPGSRYPNLFVIEAVPRAPHTVADMEKFIYEELTKLQTTPVEARELQKIVNQLEASKIRHMKSNSGMSSKLSYFQTIAGDWRYAARHIDNIRKVTPERIMEAAKKYLVKQNRLVAVLVKKGYR